MNATPALSDETFRTARDTARAGGRPLLTVLAEQSGLDGETLATALGTRF